MIVKNKNWKLLYVEDHNKPYNILAIPSDIIIYLFE